MLPLYVSFSEVRRCDEKQECLLSLSEGSGVCSPPGSGNLRPKLDTALGLCQAGSGGARFWDGAPSGRGVDAVRSRSPTGDAVGGQGVEVRRRHGGVRPGTDSPLRAPGHCGRSTFHSDFY